jgi:hypothetical protein
MVLRLQVKTSRYHRATGSLQERKERAESPGVTQTADYFIKGGRAPKILKAATHGQAQSPGFGP